MLRLIISIYFFLLSLLTVFSAPTYFLWYISILVTEFPMLLIVLTSLVLFWGFKVAYYRAIGTLVGLAALILFLRPVVGAYFMGSGLQAQFDTAFHINTATNKQDTNPFSFLRLFIRRGKNDVAFSTITYNINKTAGPLTLDYYHSLTSGKRPCVLVVHGGSWSAGDSRQLPEINSRIAKAGYNVATINYRLAPAYHSPAPIEDIQAAMAYLCAHSEELGIDTNNFVLLGRSAGGQIVLSAAYTLHDPRIKGVINFYSPTDMVWGYAHPSNPLVLDTKQIMEDYLGGTYAQVPQNYVASSATAAVTTASVPTLSIHGKNDPLVAYEHCTLLNDKLKAAGIEHFLLTLPWGTHGCDYTLNGPSGQLATYCVLRFLGLVTSGQNTE